MHVTRPSRELRLAFGGSAGSVPAPAHDMQALHMRSLAAACARCHGTAGRAVARFALPGPAGLPVTYTTQQTGAFQTSTRSATVMHQIANGFSAIQFERSGPLG